MRDAIAAVAEDFGGRGPSQSLCRRSAKAGVGARQTARGRGDYQDADRIRERLGAAGIALEDSVDGVRYRISAKQ